MNKEYIVYNTLNNESSFFKLKKDAFEFKENCSYKDQLIIYKIEEVL